MTDQFWLKALWATLAGLWGLSFIVRALLLHITWPAERKRKAAGVLVQLVMAALYVWRFMTPLDPDTLPSETFRTGVGLLLAVWVLLDGIWAIQGMAHRRARNIQQMRGEP